MNKIRNRQARDRPRKSGSRAAGKSNNLFTGSLTGKGMGKSREHKKLLNDMLNHLGYETARQVTGDGYPPSKMARINHFGYFDKGIHDEGEWFNFDANKEDELSRLQMGLSQIYNGDETLYKENIRMLINNHFSSRYTPLIDPYRIRMNWIVEQARRLEPYWRKWKESGFDPKAMKVEGKKIPFVATSLDDVYLLDHERNKPEIVEFGSTLVYTQIMQSYLDYSMKGDSLLTIASQGVGIGKTGYISILGRYLNTIGEHDEQISKQLMGIQEQDYFYSIPGFNNPDDVEMLRKIAGMLLIELSESVIRIEKGMTRQRLNDVKGFLSRTIDIHRGFHTKQKLYVPRRCCFVYTTNSLTPIPNEDSSNRRFIVVYVKGSIVDRWNLETNNIQKAIGDSITKYLGNMFTFKLSKGNLIQLRGFELLLAQAYLGLQDETFSTRPDTDTGIAIERLNDIAVFKDESDRIDDIAAKRKVVRLLMKVRNKGLHIQELLKQLQKFDEHNEWPKEFNESYESVDIDEPRLKILLQSLENEKLIESGTLPRTKNGKSTTIRGYRLHKDLGLPRINRKESSKKEWDEAMGRIYDERFHPN